MRATKIGIGEGWRFVGLTAGAKPIASMFAPRRAPIMASAGLAPPVVDPDALESEGLDVFVNTYGRVFAREPDAPAAFRAPPHELASPRPAAMFEGLFR